MELAVNVADRLRKGVNDREIETLTEGVTRRKSMKRLARQRSVGGTSCRPAERSFFLACSTATRCS